MTLSHLVGIGGTGAKCVEATLHLAAAGLGPEQLTIGYVDADDGNGNYDRARRVLGRYTAARQRLRRESEARMSRDCPLFQSVVKRSANGGRWSPLADATATMRDLFRYELMDEASRFLFDGLFLKDDEQTMALHEGFAGRPNVGAAVLGASAHAGDPFWRELFDTSEQAGEGREGIRIFLVGSIFGGTGAAGFPVIARMLRHHIQRQEIGGRVKLGGALLLPYFSFPPSQGERLDIGALSSTFLAKTQQALAYYHRLMRDEGKVFDDLYLVGLPEPIPMSHRCTGGPRQANPPMLPELYGALAALRFFRIGPADEQSILHIATARSDRIEWDDLPEVGSQEGEVKRRLGQLVRFAFAYARVYGPLLGRDSFHRYARQHWFRRLISRSRGSGVDLADDDAQQTIGDLAAYCEELLRWIATLATFSGQHHLAIDLIDPTSYVSDGALEDDGLVKLNSRVRRDHLRQFDKLVAEAQADGLDRVFLGLSYDRVPKDARGLGRFVETLFNQCHV